MNRKSVVTGSMLWLGFLIFASRDWSQNVRDYVRAKTGHDTPAKASAPTDAYGSDWRVFLVGYIALFVLLTALAEAETTEEFGAALALTIAGGATVLYLPAVLKNLGLLANEWQLQTTKGGTGNGGTQ